MSKQYSIRIRSIDGNPINRDILFEKYLEISSINMDTIYEEAYILRIDEPDKMDSYKGEDGSTHMSLIGLTESFRNFQVPLIWRKKYKNSQIYVQTDDIVAIFGRRHISITEGEFANFDFLQKYGIHVAKGEKDDTVMIVRFYEEY